LLCILQFIFAIFVIRYSGHIKTTSNNIGEDFENRVWQNPTNDKIRPTEAYITLLYGDDFVNATLTMI